MSDVDAISKSFDAAQECLRRFCADRENMNRTAAVSRLLATVFQKGGKAMVAGNGGSACDGMHFAEEFTGKFRKDRRPLPVITLTDAAHLTAVGNDFGFEHVFARSVEAFGKEGDVFVGITTSGNSPNIIRAVEASRRKKITTVGLLGRDGGKSKGTFDHEFLVTGETSDRIQEVHMTILHIVIEGVERILFPENYR
jgi:D-sedoheptulose 7-phosphate isomerase